MKHLTLFSLIFTIIFYAEAQIPPQSRLTDWTKAGTHATLPTYHHIPFPGDPTGVNDNSASLQAILDTITQPTIVLFGEGTFQFKKRINLKANTVLKGLGNTKTHLRFHQDGAAAPCIAASGVETGAFFPLTLGAFKDGKTIQVSNANSNNFKAGDYFRIMQDDATLVFDSWAANRTGQMVKVDSVKAGIIYLSSPLRANYPLSANPQIRKVNMLRFSGIECLKISRQDYSNSGAGSANIDLRVVSDFRISGVESFQCNYAHAEIVGSSNITIEDNYFHDAFDFGGGGRAYGIMLHLTTGEVLVQNNIFRKLRHAMILQAGANGNVFAYNYAYEGRKEVIPGFLYTAGEDMVCHGNYPYLNLFEGNYAQFGSVDASHGKNGPYNTFFRNIATIGGFGVSSTESPSQNFTGNHSLAGSNSFKSSDHHVTDNSWQGASALSYLSLAYSVLPGFLSGYNIGPIGPPAFNSLSTIPARNRVNSGNNINRNCDVMIWEGGEWQGGFMPSDYTTDYRMVVMPGSNALITKDARVKSIELKQGAKMSISPGIKLQIIQ